MSDNTARRSWLLLTLGILFVVASIIGATHGSASGSTPTPPPRTHWMRTLCPQEDSTNCAWNANAEGNGVGHSFYSVTRHLTGPHGHRLGRVTCVYYVKAIDDKRWGGCHLLPAGAPTHPRSTLNATSPASLTIGSDPDRYLDSAGNTVYAPRLFWTNGVQCVNPGQLNCLLPATNSENASGHDVYFRAMPDGSTCQFYKGQTYANSHDICGVFPHIG